MLGRRYVALVGSLFVMLGMIVCSTAHTMNVFIGKFAASSEEQQGDDTRHFDLFLFLCLILHFNHPPHFNHPLHFDHPLHFNYQQTANPEALE